jgi:hypothetical protein
MKEENIENDNNKIIYTAFNQDYKCFLVGTKEGCIIYHSEPFKNGFKLGKKKKYNKY